MGKYLIQTIPENCSGCSRCRLACSEANTRMFKPSAAHIRVEMSGTDCTIIFTEACIGCGICSDNCFYNALTKTIQEDAS